MITKNAKRHEKGSMLLGGDGFVEVEDGGAEEGVGGGFVGGVTVEVTMKGGGENFQFLGSGLAIENVEHCACDPVFGSGGFVDDAVGQSAGGGDEGGFVEESEGLEGRVGSRFADGAGFASGGIECREGRRWDGSLPKGVETAANEVGAFAGLIVAAAGELGPEAGRLKWFDGWAAELFDQLAAGEEGLVAEHFGGQPQTWAVPEKTIV